MAYQATSNSPARHGSSSTSSTTGEVVLDGFKRLESIGKGSFATVYRGIHPVDKSLVAIKTTNTTQLKGKLKANLLAEIDILKSIHHPHIVGLISIVETPGYIHLVMEFCQLGDLATFVKKREKLATHPVTAEMIRNYPNPPNAGFNEVVVRHFSKQLAAALEFLRSKHVVHRDLKPQNLLLNPPPSWLARERFDNRPFEVVKDSLIPIAGVMSLPSLKIADFGFARHLPTTTMAETLCGSPLYMAPEILRYEKYDAKADLWSVGTVLYELMVGKAPFRAANHVDLLRKIEKAMDRIKFPEDLKVSTDMKTVIRGLLRKMPTERISWEEFFQSPVNVNEIPGLAPSDRRERPITTLEDAASPSPSPTATAAAAASRPRSHTSSRDRPAALPESAESELAGPSSNRPTSKPASTPPPYPSQQIQPSPQQRKSISQARRPSLTSHATAPAMQTLAAAAAAALPPPSQNTAMERRVSQESASPRSAARETFEHDRVARLKRERAARDARERAAQDVAFERDYVVVEKRAVEVNAFADELAASPQIQGARRDGLSTTNPAGLPRRATTQAVPLAAPGASPPNHNKQVALRAGDGPHYRKDSYERRFGAGQLSATSALAAALNMVNFRLGGHGTPPLAKSPSPPQGYGAFPSFPITQPMPLLLGESPKAVALDEDQRVLSIVEESATRSDVVYGFAEVKYKQLAPAEPSNENHLGMHRKGGADHRAGRSSSPIDDDDLTPDAIVTISEEALVLYVKTLSILTNTINIAGNWWQHKNRGGVIGDVSTLPGGNAAETGRSPSFAATGVRINFVVQWARNRFNDCLSKSEYVSRRLLNAQKRLPNSHPGHPDNFSEMDEPDTGDNINLSSGVTAEALMYERALDMNTTAAVNELMNTDLRGCEVSYVTAIRLFEAVLERDTEPSGSIKKSSPSGASNNSSKNVESKGSKDSVGDAERAEVVQMIKETQKRLTTLHEKMAAAARNSSPHKSSSSGATATASPKQLLTHSPGSVAAADGTAVMSSPSSYTPASTLSRPSTIGGVGMARYPSR